MSERGVRLPYRLLMYHSQRGKNSPDYSKRVKYKIMKRFRNTNYLINEDGSVYNEKTQKYLKPTLRTYWNGSQYYIITLRVDNKSKTFLHHRVVAEIHIDNPDNLPQINHKDGNSLYNHKDNLEWCTQSYNNIHAIENGLRPTKINLEIADKIRKESTTLTQEELSKKYNLSKSHIRKIIKFERWVR